MTHHNVDVIVDLSVVYQQPIQNEQPYQVIGESEYRLIYNES